LFPDLLDVGDDMVKEYILGKDSDVSEEEFNKLMTPTGLTVAQKEEQDLIRIAKLAKEQGIAEGITDEIKAELEKHSKEFYFISNDYEKVPFLDAAYFERKLKELLKHDPGELEKKKQQAFEAQKQEIQSIINKHNLNKDSIRRLDFFNWLTLYRDQRKKYNQISNYFLIKTADLIAEKNNIENILAYMLLQPEVADVVKKGVSHMLDELKQRLNNGVFCAAYHEEWHISDDRAPRYWQIVESTIAKKDLKGTVACKGVGKGKIKIVLTQDDFSKFNQGDILVAHMTRPEYVPLMKIASAILTDEGGLTCHAAIVSRELDVPCIVGTQVATTALNDNDEVEVDADNGTIKVLGRA
jgi:phosphohistidine swiveling domain-containing protein